VSQSWLKYLHRLEEDESVDKELLDRLYEGLANRIVEGYAHYRPAKVEDAGGSKTIVGLAALDTATRELYYIREEGEDDVRLFSVNRERVGKIEWLAYPDGYLIPEFNFYHRYPSYDQAEQQEAEPVVETNGPGSAKA
jgi:hypothetical protein